MISKYREHNYTYEEWLELDTEELYELIDGRLYLMAGPSSRHQVLSFRLSRLFGDYLGGSDTCQVFVSPYSVRLHEAEDTVLFPDVLILCDIDKMKEGGMVGAPNLVVEILSPSTSRHDRILKYNEYLRAGVPEYWIVDPARKTVTVNVLTGGHYESCNYCEGEIAQSTEFPGLHADISRLFGGRWMQV